MSNLSKYFSTIALICLLLIASYILGAKYSFVFIVWWFLFSALHYILYKRLNCPETLTPAVCFSFIVLLLQISGFCGSLHYAYWLIILLGFYGAVCIVLDNKLSFWRAYVFQPKVIWCYYILAFVLFLQSIYLSNKITHVDDRHHWMYIINGIGFYHRINNFPILKLFTNYTLGGALWGYFINRLSGYFFRINITYWSNSLIYAIFFIPGLSFIKTNNKVFLFNFLLLLISFCLFCFDDMICLLIGAFLIITVIINLCTSKETITETIIFCSYFLFYSFLIVTPFFNLSLYRHLPPDIIIFLIPAACLLAYMLSPSIRTLLWISPVLAMPYLFKIPGLYFAISVSVTILLHYFIAKKKQIFNSFKYKHNLNILILISFVCLLLAIMLPPIAWKGYCKVQNNENTALFKTSKFSQIDNIKKSFFDKTDQQFYKTRLNFFKKFYNAPMFDVKLDFNSFLSPLVFVDSYVSNVFKNLKSNCLTYPKILSFLLILEFLSILLLSNSKHLKKVYILLLLLSFFTIIHIAGLLVNYCLMFTHGERFQIPAYQRYAAPMLKILFLAIIGSFYTYLLHKKGSLSKYLLLCVVLILSICLCGAAGLKSHVYKHKYGVGSTVLSQLLPPNFDFRNKKVLFVGKYTSRPDNELGLLLMNYKYSVPVVAEYIYKNSKYNSNIFKYYDLLFWLQEDLFQTNNISNDSLQNYIFKSVDDISFLSYSSLFAIENDNETPHLRLIYKNAVAPTNILYNGDFKFGLKGWQVSKNGKANIVIVGGENTLKLERNTIVSTALNVKANKCYVLKCNVNNCYDDSCGSIGNALIYLSGNSIYQYFKFTKDGEVVMKFMNKSNQFSISNIQFIDLGCQ